MVEWWIYYTFVFIFKPNIKMYFYIFSDAAKTSTLEYKPPVHSTGLHSPIKDPSQKSIDG